MKVEDLSLDNILDVEQINDLFTEGNDNSSDDSSSEGIDKKQTTETVDPEDLFNKSESVGSEGENQERENTESEKDIGTSPNNFYSSIASALKDEGILSSLDDESVKEITSPEDFAEAIDKHIKSQLDERQKRIDEALQVGLEPTQIKKYESTINYLNGISEETLVSESSDGEKLRKQLIYQDFLNRGYDEKRALREVNKSFSTGSDIEDAKEALNSTKNYFTEQYEDLIAEAKEQEEAEKAEIKKRAEQLKKSILEDKEVFEGLPLDKQTRSRVYDSITKPIYKDPESGEYLTALQKYEKDNKTDFMKKLGVLFTLTDGFSNLEKLIKPTVKKQVNKSLRELEHTINTTNRNIDGSLNYINDASNDPESKVGWDIDI